jgi:2-polyprenyl-3-methyl-5-hydroxy-6-metoxy-1,4-benzoquinol methylase
MGDDKRRGSSEYPIDYGPEFLERVREMHDGAEELPGYEGWIEDHMGGRVETFRSRLLPQIRAFTGLENMDILDFGCGTGSTTVMLAEVGEGSRITAADIDPRSLELARMRFEHHGLSPRITLMRIDPVRRIGDLEIPSGSFDFVLMNGVLEHVVPAERRSAVILEAWRVLRPGGMLFISETPNLLWPFDRHTTGLPLIPWLPSSLARRYALALGRLTGKGDLDAWGRRGMTYWGIVRPLKKAARGAEVLNITMKHNRLFPAGPPGGSPAGLKRRIGSFILEDLLGGLLTRLGIPVLAFGPFIEFLCLKKR